MLSLIVAIGAQNLFVLRQGLRREHVGIVVAICAVSDAVLVAVGVVGVGALVDAVPWVVTAVRWAGAIFLVAYGAVAGWRALRPQGERLVTAEPGVVVAARTSSVIATCLALTWLNPHVYLDTLFLVGTVAASHESPSLFAVGAMTASVVWFSALGFGARALAPLFATERAWRILDGVIAVVMVALGVGLALGA